MAVGRESGISNLRHGRGPQRGCAMLQLPGSSLGATASDGCQEGCEEGREEVSAGAWGHSNRSSGMLLRICCGLVVARGGRELHLFRLRHVDFGTTF